MLKFLVVNNLLSTCWLYPWRGFNMDFIEWYVNWTFLFLSPIKLI